MASGQALKSYADQPAGGFHPRPPEVLGNCARTQNTQHPLPQPLLLCRSEHSHHKVLGEVLLKQNEDPIPVGVDNLPFAYRENCPTEDSD